jgi:hypothetical protein
MGNQEKPGNIDQMQPINNIKRPLVSPQKILYRFATIKGTFEKRKPTAAAFLQD